VAAPRPRILILGLPHFGKMLAPQLSGQGWHAEYLAHPGRNPLRWLALLPSLARADVLYLISSRVDGRSPQAMLLRVRKRPTVIQWVGTDALIATEEHARGNVARSVVRKPTHWVDAPWLADELAPLGIHAEYVPLPIPVPNVDPPLLPAEFRVLLYLPEDTFDREVFDTETLLRLPHEFPEVAFTLRPASAATLPPLPANVATPGWSTDVDALYADITVVVRLTNHDGVSFMAVEALARGRYVVWTFPMPGAIQAAGFEPVAAAIRDLHARHRAGSLALNEPGMAYVRANFDEPALLAALDHRLRTLAGERGLRTED
jgi:hypothetical protein